MIGVLSYLLMFLSSLGALCIYPFYTFIILINKWGLWINKNINEGYEDKKE